MIVDTLSPDGEPTTTTIVDKTMHAVDRAAFKARKPRKPIETKNERDIVFAVGMACLSSISEPGERHTCEEIAEFTGLSRQRIEQIENRALRKIRAALYQDKKLSKELEMFLNTR